jgi:anhydro-N-acetylmuramic acid kinase
MASYKVLGLMSGTSLDGLDVAYCIFSLQKGIWKFSLEKAHTFKYTASTILKLSKAKEASALELSLLSNELATQWAKNIGDFIQNNNIKADFVASHGHTIFHQPEKGLTVQIGNGAKLSAMLKLPVICDFRTTDVALGGQGAPLVPIGDELLFSNFGYCLNLGGIANISFKEKNKRIAFDISACNILLNYLAEKKGKKYDKNGNWAKEGKTNKSLLEKLNNQDYFSKKAPKSLGIEWIQQNQISIIEKSTISIEDKLATVSEHIAIQIANSIKKTKKQQSLLITGGGAFNSYLISRIKHHLAANITVEIPDKNIISFKEALIFGFLGVLRYRQEKNCLQSVTGAKSDNIGGCIYWF